MKEKDKISRRTRPEKSRTNVTQIARQLVPLVIARIHCNWPTAELCSSRSAVSRSPTINLLSTNAVHMRCALPSWKNAIARVLYALT